MIYSFTDKETQKIFNQQFSSKFLHHIQERALRKLIMVDSAAGINDLYIPPANHLERLIGNLRGLFSIKINSQYQIQFSVTNTNYFVNVGIVDYH